MLPWSERTACVTKTPVRSLAEPDIADQYARPREAGLTSAREDVHLVTPKRTSRSTRTREILPIVEVTPYSHVENDESVKFARANLIRSARHLNEIHKAPSPRGGLIVEVSLGEGLTGY